MLLADMVIHPVDPALDYRKETLNRICMSVASDIFVGRMVNCLVAGKPFADLPVDAALIGAEMRVCREHFGDNRLDRICRNVRSAKMERAHRALAFH